MALLCKLASPPDLSAAIALVKTEGAGWFTGVLSPSLVLAAATDVDQLLEDALAAAENNKEHDVRWLGPH